jgi:hypothetical protein
MSTEIDNDLEGPPLSDFALYERTDSRQKDRDKRIADLLTSIFSFSVEDYQQPNFSASLKTRALSLITSSEKIEQASSPAISFPHRIAMICGMNTSENQAKSHAAYLNHFFPETIIHLIPNKSHGALLDIMEIFLLNYSGISLCTAKMLRESWLAFHKNNKDNFSAKILQFCHSQGAIHVRNALLWLPKEIQQRIIVIAIAPAAIVPDDCCFQSFNYASKRDLIHLSELAFLSSLEPSDSNASDTVKRAMENHKQLILLDPHPDAKGFDHDFESPTFSAVIEGHMKNYMQNKGEFA